MGMLPRADHATVLQTMHACVSCPYRFILAQQQQRIVRQVCPCLLPTKLPQTFPKPNTFSGSTTVLMFVEHVQVWHDDTCIDAFGIGADLGETRRAGVRGMLPSAEPRTVWESANGIDAFSVFVEEKVSFPNV
eukprot:2485484-Rhodomonas_salina.1